MRSFVKGLTDSYSLNIVSLLARHRVWAHHSGVSDHYPVLFEWMDHPVSCPLPFKFNHSWLSNEDFVKMIRSERPLFSSRNPVGAMEDLSVKLRLLKGKVKDWTRSKSLEMKDKSILIDDEIKVLLESSSSGIMGARHQSRPQALRLES